MRLYSRALAVLMVAGCTFNMTPGSALEQGGAHDLRLTLSSQTVWQSEHGGCAFSAEIIQGHGGLSYRCGGTPPPGAVRRRMLTDLETATLRRLYDTARLFDGGHVGEDSRAADLPLLNLRVESTPGDRRTAVLVVSGNPTFSSGPRRALLDWLLSAQQDLLR